MPPTPRGINSVNLILDHASRLFLSNGFRSTTVEQIARAADLSKGAVYFHFEDKAALALRLLQRAEEQLEEAIAVAMAGSQAQDCLVRFLHQRSLLARLRPDYWLLTAMLSVELAGSKTVIETRVKKVYQRLDSFLEQLVAEGMEQGLFTAELPAKEQAAIIVATHDGMLLQWRRRGKQLKGEHLVRAMRRSVLLGLGAELAVEEKPEQPLSRAK